MSRSLRKTPIIGNAVCDSEKSDKVAAHRAERRATDAALLKGEEPPHPREYGNPWKAGKDGKHYWAAMPAEFFRK